MNKRYFIVWALCLFSSMILAQTADDYHPFAQDGKIWEIQIGGIKENVYGNTIDGDTLINGVNWKKVYNYVGSPDFNYSYYAAIRDVEKKVYIIAKDSSRPRLLYDFGLKVGDELKCGIEGNAFGCLRDTEEKPDTLLGFPFVSYLKVKSIDTIHVSGQYVRESYFRRFTLMLLDAFKEPVSKREIIWVEGIGSVAGPFLPWIPIPEIYSMILRCKIGKEYLFSFSGRSETATVRALQYQNAGSRDVHDLQGHRLSSLPQKGIYIQNGKKKISK